MFKFTEAQEDNRGSGRQIRQAIKQQHIYQTPGEILVNPPVTS